MLGVYEHMYDQTGRLPEGLGANQFANARRRYGGGFAMMTLHFIGLRILTGVYDEVTTGEVPAARHNVPGKSIVTMHHTSNLRGELEITGWQCVIEMLWHGIGAW